MLAESPDNHYVSFVEQLQRRALHRGPAPPLPTTPQPKASESHEEFRRDLETAAESLDTASAPAANRGGRGWSASTPQPTGTMPWPADAELPAFELFVHSLLRRHHRLLRGTLRP